MTLREVDVDAVVLDVLTNEGLGTKTNAFTLLLVFIMIPCATRVVTTTTRERSNMSMLSLSVMRDMCRVWARPTGSLPANGSL